jgi:hypothetical protein
MPTAWHIRPPAPRTGVGPCGDHRPAAAAEVLAGRWGPSSPCHRCTPGDVTGLSHANLGMYRVQLGGRYVPDRRLACTQLHASRASRRA